MAWKITGALALAITIFGAVPLLAQSGFMDIGRLMRISRDYQYIQSGCVHSYDSSSELFVCARREQLRPDVIDVTLWPGQQTTVLSPLVTSGTMVSCGCDHSPAQQGTASCNAAGRLIAQVIVAEVAPGSFTIWHGNALGNERIRCAIG